MASPADPTPPTPSLDGGLVLALDASTPRAVVALGRVSVARSEATLLAGREVSDQPSQASRAVVPAIEALLSDAGVEASALDAVACGRGPGMFTGTRVAVATAMGLAVGAGCPVIEVSTLAAVAASLGRAGTALALLDARRDEVYGAAFAVQTNPWPEVRALGSERCTALSTLLRELTAQEDSDDLAPVGPGVQPYADALPPAMAARAHATAGPTPDGLWLAAISALSGGQVVAPQALRAVYLRQSYAEMGVHPPKNPVPRSPFV